MAREKRPDLERPQDPHGMGREAYDAECAAIAHALETAATRRSRIGNLATFTDTQAAIGE